MRTVLCRLAENFVFVIVLIGASLIIGVLLAATWLVQLVAGIAEDPNASPYRQVR